MGVHPDGSPKEADVVWCLAPAACSGLQWAPAGANCLNSALEVAGAASCSARGVSSSTEQRSIPCIPPVPMACMTVAPHPLWKSCLSWRSAWI